MSSHAQPFSIETLIDILIAETDRLETRKYAEIGIPMFLVGEDLTAEVAAPAEARLADSLGANLAQLAGALALRKPELDLDDVAKLLEVLADRYFVAPADDDATARPAVEDQASPLLLPGSAPPALAEIANAMARHRTIRLVNFHSTPRYREDEFRRQIESYAPLFEPVTPGNFASAIDGTWPHSRPGLLPALFEGYRDNYDVMLPILEEYGLTGWFFVPSAFLDVPDQEQRDYAANHELHLPEQDEYPDQRIALTWDEAREISRRGHVFACHTRTHNEVRPDTPRAVLEDEIVVAKRDLETRLGTGVDIFCWLEGAAVGVNPQADAMLREAGFKYLFSNFKIQKLQ